MSPKKYIYLAGKMRGVRDFNFPAFHRHAAWLREEGHDVFNPAEADEAKYGVGFARCATGDPAEIPQFNLRGALRDCLHYITTTATAIALIPGWETSAGVAAELATAKALGLEVIRLGQAAGAEAAPAAPESILAEALRVTAADRQDNYGHPLANHLRIAALWNGYLEARALDAEGKPKVMAADLGPMDVVSLMVLLKIARELHSTKRDNFTDMAGYARCGARIQGHEA